MKKTALLSSTAIGLLLCVPPFNAQAQQKGSDEKATRTQQGSGVDQLKEQAPSGKSVGPEGTSQREMKEKPGKGAAQTPPKEGKGTAEKGAEPKDKGTAEKNAEPVDQSTKSTVERTPERKDKAGSSNRVQLTEEKRTNVGRTLAKDANLNRATNIKISVNRGERLPQSVRLVALPASVITIVPEYRSYRYVVVNDQICIVEPSSFEIVEIIQLSGQTAATGGPTAALILSEEERAIILREVDLSGGSTLGLGAIAEGIDVPRDVQVRVFPDVVVQKVPKVKAYKFFTVENRIAIVDPQGAKVQLVLEHPR
jgi:hypothetical protein